MTEWGAEKQWSKSDPPMVHVPHLKTNFWENYVPRMVWSTRWTIRWLSVNKQNVGQHQWDAGELFQLRRSVCQKVLWGMPYRNNQLTQRIGASTRALPCPSVFEQSPSTSGTHTLIQGWTWKCFVGAAKQTILSYGGAHREAKTERTLRLQRNTVG